MMANKPIDEIRAAIRGHIPAAVFVRASERKKIPTETPESNARPKPGGKLVTHAKIFAFELLDDRLHVIAVAAGVDDLPLAVA